MLHFPQNLNVKSLISACLFVREAEQRAFVPTSNRKGGFLVFSEATTFAEKKSSRAKHSAGRIYFQNEFHVNAENNVKHRQ